MKRSLPLLGRKVEPPIGTNGYSMVQYSMIWYVMLLYSIVWYGMVWYGIAWHGMVLYLLYGVTWYVLLWYVVVWYVLVLQIQIMFWCYMIGEKKKEKLYGRVLNGILLHGKGWCGMGPKY